MDGDIMVPPCMSQFKLECKNYKVFDYHKLFTKNIILDKWIKQVENGKLWFLIIKVTSRGSYILFQLDVDYAANDSPILEIKKTNSTGTTPVWKYNIPLFVRGDGRIRSFTHIQYVDPGDKISVTSTGWLKHIHFKGFKLAS